MELWPMMERILRALPSKPQPLWIRYGVTTFLVLLCFLLMKGVQDFSPIQGYFLLFPAIFLAAIVFDRGTGFYATGLSTLLLAPWGGIPGPLEFTRALDIACIVFCDWYCASSRE
jgi:hypothetical protein